MIPEVQSLIVLLGKDRQVYRVVIDRGNTVVKSTKDANKQAIQTVDRQQRKHPHEPSQLVLAVRATTTKKSRVIRAKSNLAICSKDRKDALCSVLIRIWPAIKHSGTSYARF